MTRWLAAAKGASPLPDNIDRNDKNPPARIKSILSISSEGGGPVFSGTGHAALPPKDITDITDITQRQVADSTPKRNPKVVLSVMSVLSEEGKALSDADRYAEALRQIGPCGYGPIAICLGWGATRAANAEETLRKDDRIIYDKTGRGRLVTQ